MANSSFAQRELKWKPLRSFEEGLDETIQWYIDNQSWWEPLLERIQIKLQAPASKACPEISRSWGFLGTANELIFVKFIGSKAAWARPCQSIIF
jgi:hypothetical protein